MAIGSATVHPSLWCRRLRPDGLRVRAAAGTEPTFGETELNVGGGPALATVKFNPFEVKPPTVTVTGPVVAPLGTWVVSVLAVAESVVAVSPLNLI